MNKAINEALPIGDGVVTTLGLRELLFTADKLGMELTSASTMITEAGQIGSMCCDALAFELLAWLLVVGLFKSKSRQVLLEVRWQQSKLSTTEICTGPFVC